MPKPKKSLESHRESPSETCFEDAPLFFGPKKTEQVKGRKGEEKKERETERREKIYGASPAFFLAKRKPEG